jgi:hypothetical protein
MKVLAKKCEDCPYDLTCSMKKIVNHKIPCYAVSDAWIFKFIRKFGKGARVREEMFK